jgi:catechol 2,3-dioxygenase-like lactoylglutathione lyase family enzyme
MAPDRLDSLRLPIVPIEPRPEFVASLRRRIASALAVEPEPERERVRDVPTVRYYVDDLDLAVEFYCERLDFDLELRAGEAFAMLYRGELRLLLSTPEPHRLPDGTLPAPGGWNRISLRVPDLERAVRALRQRGTRFRTEITTGAAVDSVLLEDPAGNLVELFEARTGYHERGGQP